MVAGAVIAANQGGGSKLRRIRAYLKAHWKELLALTFAAIPALFIVFHKPARDAATKTISYPASLFGPPGGGSPGAPPGPSGGGDPGGSIPTPQQPLSTVPIGPAPQSWSGPKAVAMSVNGYNPVSVAPPSIKTEVLTASMKYREPQPISESRGAQKGGPVVPADTPAVTSPGAVVPAPNLGGSIGDVIQGGMGFVTANVSAIAANIAKAKPAPAPAPAPTAPSPVRANTPPPAPPPADLNQSTGSHPGGHGVQEY